MTSDMNIISVDHVRNNLNRLAQQAEERINYYVSQCNEKINSLSYWKDLAVKEVENSSGNDVKKVKKISQSAIFKAKNSVSLPVGKQLRGKKKISFLNACSKRLHEIQSNLEETPKATRNTKSLYQNNASNKLKSHTKSELLTLQSELNVHYENFLCSKPKRVNISKDTVKQKCFDGILESQGVKAKIFTEHSVVNGTRFPSLKINKVDNYDEVVPLIEVEINDEVQNVQPDSNKTFEVQEENVEKDSKPIELTTVHVNDVNFKCNSEENTKTPIGKLTLDLRNNVKTMLSHSNGSGTPVIKKKNLTSYLNSKSILSNEKCLAIPCESVKLKDSADIQSVVSSEKSNYNGRQLRNLRSKPPTDVKLPPKRSKRLRTKDSPIEKQDKCKQREENVKQQKIDAQLKKEEKKQQREERMRKTKEARERLEQERRDKVQSSEEKKRQRTDINKDLEVKKKTKVTRQTSKMQTTKQTAPTLKVPRKTKKSLSNIKTQKLKKPCLETVDETETVVPDSSSSPKTSTFIVNKSANKEQNPSHNKNSTFTLEKTPVDEVKTINDKFENCIVLNSNNCHISKQNLSATVSNATFTHSKSSEEIKPKTPPVSSFKKPHATPFHSAKNPQKDLSDNSRNISGDANYELTPYRDEDEDSVCEDEPKKPIPNWASGIRLKEAIIKQACYPPDLNKLFGKIPRHVDLAEIFGGQRRKNYKKRTSSAVWRNISFNLDI